MASTTSRRAQQPDHLGLLILKERGRRRLSNVVEGSVKRDVSGSATMRRRLSLSLDGSPKYTKYYFELSGHLLKWWEEFGPGRDERGQISLLSCHRVRDLTREERANLPPGTNGGFCLVDAATDLVARRGDIFLFGENQSDVKDWIQALRSSFSKFHVSPLAGLGPIQAATEKPIIEGELLARDATDGIPQQTWTKLLVSLFDNRIECRRPQNPELIITPIAIRRKSFIGPNVPTGVSTSANTPLQVGPTCRVDRLTINFYVGDSRVCPHAFLLSDFIVTHHFAAEDDLQKLFWMQTIAKVLRNLVAMHEHAFKVKQTLAVAKSSNSKSDDEDEDDEEDRIYQEELDRRRPSQVRRESMRLFYGSNKAPKDELSTPPRELERRKSIAQQNNQDYDSDDDDDDDDDDDTHRPSGNGKRTVTVNLNQPENVPSAEMRKSLRASATNLAQSLAKMGSATLFGASTNTDKPTTEAMTIFSPLDSVSTKWVEAEFEKLVNIAQQIDKKGKNNSTRVTFGQLVHGWGEDTADDLGGVLLRAKRKGIAAYEGDMLFAGYDDGVMIDIKTK